MKLQSGVRAKSRRARALSMLEAQLKKGTKNTKDGHVPLSKKDITRIKKEIENIKKKK